MDISTLLGQLKEIGIALVSVIGFAYITKLILDKSETSNNKLIDRIDEVQRNYSAFVLENNHNSTDRIEKSTQAMVQVGNVIEAHTKVLERLTDRIDNMK